MMASASIGAKAVIGSGGMETGFSSPVGPSFNEDQANPLNHAATWAGIGAALWLAILYMHWRAY